MHKHVWLYILGECINIYTNGSRYAETDPRSSEKHRRDVSDRNTRFRWYHTIGQTLYRIWCIDDSHHAPRHGFIFFYYFYYFFYDYGERCENVIQYDTKAQIDDNDSVLSRISHVTKLRSFNRHQTWQPVRNTVYMFVCMRLHAEIYTRSQLTRQIYVAVKCIRDDLA